MIEWRLEGWEVVGKEGSSVFSAVSITLAPPSLKWHTTLFLKQSLEVIVRRNPMARMFTFTAPPPHCPGSSRQCRERNKAIMLERKK